MTEADIRRIVREELAAAAPAIVKITTQVAVKSAEDLRRYGLRR